MTPQQLDATAAYVRVVRNWLGLQHWHVDVLDEEPGNEEARAEVATTDGRYHAALRVGPGFLTAKAAAQRQTIVHELLHLVAREANDAVRVSGLSSVLSRDAYLLVWESYKAAHERATDHLASVIAEYAPLPRLKR